MGKQAIPSFVSYVTEKLQKAGFEAYLVGGCVRDLLTGKAPKDWDVTTNARPENIQKVFGELKTVCENNFGTVTVLNMPPKSEESIPSADGNSLASKRGTPDPDNIVQVTTYRSEGKYSDFRRPDEVTYETELEKDLERRDFTMNAIAYDPIKDILKDKFNGIRDIKDKIIRCVLKPEDRFQEDALRMLRAVRFSTELGFAIENDTLNAIFTNAVLLKEISPERIRDEFLKIIKSRNPSVGIGLLQKTRMLEYIVPELLEGVGCEQKGSHIYDVYDHIVHALQHAADKDFSTDIRLSALFHDIGKPHTRRVAPVRGNTRNPKGDGIQYTFYGHEVVGARMTKKILERLHFPRETVSRVTTLVRNHMFFSDTEKITLSAVRRIIKNVGADNIWFLMQVRECDRVGMKKAEAPYRLRKYHAMIDEALRDPISVGQLAIDGNYMMKELGIKPGPRMGWILHGLLEEVLEDPKLNTVELLSERTRDLNELEDKDLKKLGEKAKQQKDILEEQEVNKLHQKHGVKANKKI